MNARQKMTVVAVDLGILAELCVGMHVASLDPDNFTVAFCRSFFQLLLPTLAAGIILIRVLRDKKQPDSEPTTA